MKKMIACILSVLFMVSAVGCTSNLNANEAAETANTDAAAEETNASVNTSSSDAADVILNGFSAKKFVQKEVSQEDIELILQCGAKAPSARNTQLWHFTVVTNAQKASELAGGAVEGTVVIVVSGLTETIEGVNVAFDCALAVENMYIATQSLGLGAHIYTGPVAGINENEKENLAIPEGYEAVAVLCIGHIENEADAVSSASERNPLPDMVNYVQ